MSSLLRSALLSTSLLAVALVVKSPPPAAASQNPQDSEEETIERILELRGEAEALLDSLPPSARAEVERRWRQRPAAEPQSDQPPVPPSPPASALPLPSEPVIEIEPEAIPEEPVARVGDDRELVGAEPVCGFALLDTDRNGLVSGSDRQWRYLRLWFDNGDERIDDAEIGSLFELGVKSIDAGLRSYSNDDGESEDIDIDDRVRLRNVGKRGQKRRIGVLVIDADRLARDGELTLADRSDDSSASYQLLDADARFRLPDGRQTPVLCAGRE